MLHLILQMWKTLEKRQNESFPCCVKTLLEHAGHNKLISLEKMDETKLQNIEVFLGANKHLVDAAITSCCNNEHYRKIASFQFLPGHRLIILDLPRIIEETRKSNENIQRESAKTLKMVLIKKLITFVRKNCPKGRSYPDNFISESNIQDFSAVTKGNSQWKCMFACPFCPNKYSILFKSGWEASNATKHLRLHLKE